MDNDYWKKTPFEEDTEQLVAQCEKILGHNGRMLEMADEVMIDVFLYTHKHGIVWYGDLHANELPKVQRIAKLAGDMVTVVTENPYSEILVTETECRI